MAALARDQSYTATSIVEQKHGQGLGSGCLVACFISLHNYKDNMKIEKKITATFVQHSP